jgi:hypothetical protein
MGEYFVIEHDILNKTVFPDEVGFGGWFVDLHTPGGLLAKHSEKASATYEGEYDTFSEYMVKSYCGPYGFPLRSLIAKDLDNLMMAGRIASGDCMAGAGNGMHGRTGKIGGADCIRAKKTAEEKMDRYEYTGGIGSLSCYVAGRASGAPAEARAMYALTCADGE